MDIKENNILKTSDARRRANKKYSDIHYKTVTYKAKISDYKQIKAYADSKNISVSKLCKLCVTYCMKYNIDFASDD